MGAAEAGRRIGVNHLTGLRLGEPKLAGHLIDAAGLRELGLGETQLAILLPQLIERLLFALDAVAALDGVEVLQAVDHDEREEHGDGDGKDAHLAQRARGRRP